MRSAKATRRFPTQSGSLAPKDSLCIERCEEIRPGNFKRTAISPLMWNR
jgi:hypothetical protein